MKEGLTRPVTDAEIDTYRRDGIVCLRGFFNRDWVEHVRGAVEQNIANPSGMVKDINQAGSTGFFFGDTFVSHHIPAYRKFVDGSPAAELVGSLLGADKVNLIFDQVLVKEPGTSTKTKWHHDATYWPVMGDMIATLWLALDPVTYDTGAVEYVKGSHRWGKRFAAASFSPHESYKEDLPPVPDIDAERDQHDIVWFEMEPGDCTIHHGLTVHGAPGNTSDGVRRRAYVTRWAGHDVVYNPRPNLQRMLRDPGIAPGGPLDSDLFPVIWRRAG
ncbi:phytanoyl-CoA dioxygenase family protein [Thalassobaculum sp.]|uniref:phytanoyl-CoA dioxygenase family protein n=1 Tax=Thalassobaculum sp. TaxID=2022740 RepID=UPI0032ECFBFD